MDLSQIAADGRIFRCLYPHVAQDLRAFLSSPLAARLVAKRALVGAEEWPNGRAENRPADLRARFGAAP